MQWAEMWRLGTAMLVLAQAGAMLVVKPGEVHTFLASSEDYLHFVVQAPFVTRG